MYSGRWMKHDIMKYGYMKLYTHEIATFYSKSVFIVGENLFIFFNHILHAFILVHHRAWPVLLQKISSVHFLLHPVQRLYLFSAFPYNSSSSSLSMDINNLNEFEWYCGDVLYLFAPINVSRSISILTWLFLVGRRSCSSSRNCIIFSFILNVRVTIKTKAV